MATTTFGAVTVTSTATQIMAANNGRRVFVIQNNGGTIIYIGLDSSVTSSTGVAILPQDKWEMSGNPMWMGAIYGITVSSSADTRYWDIGG